MPIIILIVSFLKSLKKLSDAELIAAYKKSENMEYVGELFQRKTHLIASLSYKFLKNDTAAEDATYEVFEIICRDLLKHEVSNFNSWIFSVTRNHCYKKLRKEISEREKLAEEKNNAPNLMEFEEGADLRDKEQLEEQLELMEEVLETLGEEQQVCVKMFYLEKKSYQDIVAETGFELKKVKSYIQNGKRNMKITMEKRMNNTDE